MCCVILSCQVQKQQETLSFSLLCQVSRAILENPEDKTKVHLIYANVTLEDILLKVMFSFTLYVLCFLFSFILVSPFHFQLICCCCCLCLCYYHNHEGLWYTKYIQICSLPTGNTSTFFQFNYLPFCDGIKYWLLFNETKLN